LGTGTRGKTERKEKGQGTGTRHGDKGIRRGTQNKKGKKKKEPFLLALKGPWKIEAVLTGRMIVPMLVILYLIPVAQAFFTQTPCATGYYCPSFSQAILCPANFYCAENVTAPVPCPHGYITLSLGATSQGACIIPTPTPTPTQVADFSLRGSYNTTSGCSIHIQGWCSFTDTQRNGIIAGFVLLYVVVSCICCCCKALEDKSSPPDDD
jgi:hypothetical protein